jgi:hypothetical protein
LLYVPLRQAPPDKLRTGRDMPLEKREGDGTAEFLYVLEGSVSRDSLEITFTNYIVQSKQAIQTIASSNTSILATFLMIWIHSIKHTGHNIG